MVKDFSFCREICVLFCLCVKNNNNNIITDKQRKLLEENKKYEVF